MILLVQIVLGAKFKERLNLWHRGAAGCFWTAGSPAGREAVPLQRNLSVKNTKWKKKQGQLLERQQKASFSDFTGVDVFLL